MQNRALVKALNPSLHTLPHQETSEENSRAKSTCQGFTAAGRYNSVTVHQPLAESQEQIGIVSHDSPEHGREEEKAFFYQFPRNSGYQS